MLEIFILLLCVYALFYQTKYDSTDNGNKRSGMRIYIDNATGCHYLGKEFGGLTPRLDMEGKHICGGYKKEQQLKNRIVEED